MLVVPMRAAPQPAAPAAAGPVRILLPLARTGGFAPAYVTWERGRG